MYYYITNTLFSNDVLTTFICVAILGALTLFYDILFGRTMSFGYMYATNQMGSRLFVIVWLVLGTLTDAYAFAFSI